MISTFSESVLPLSAPCASRSARPCLPSNFKKMYASQQVSTYLINFVRGEWKCEETTQRSFFPANLIDIRPWWALFWEISSVPMEQVSVVKARVSLWVSHEICRNKWTEQVVIEVYRSPRKSTIKSWSKDMSESCRRSPTLFEAPTEVLHNAHSDRVMKLTAHDNLSPFTVNDVFGNL